MGKGKGNSKRHYIYLGWMIVITVSIDKMPALTNTWTRAVNKTLVGHEHIRTARLKTLHL